MKVTRYYIYQDRAVHSDPLKIVDDALEAQQWCEDWVKEKMKSTYPNLNESDESYEDILNTFICSLSIIPKKIDSEEVKTEKIKQSIEILNEQVQVLFNNDERKIAEQIDEAVSQLEEKYL